MDVQASVLRPTRYPFEKEQGLNDSPNFGVGWAGISFDSSRIAAVSSLWAHFRIWDLSSGTLLHAFDSNHISRPTVRWSRTDLYLLCETAAGYRYLNPESFKEEIVSKRKPDDRFQEPDRLYHHRNKLRIRSSRRTNGSDDPLFLTLPPRLHIDGFYWHGDRVCILCRGGHLLLLDISCLDTYMKEYCHIESEPEGELRKDIQYSLVK